MVDAVISDAIPCVQDEGLPSISDDNEDWNSAGTAMLIGQTNQTGSYVRSSDELTFANHDGGSDEVDVTAGVAYLDMTGETINVQSGLGGTTPPPYDTTLPVEPSMPVVVPTTVSNVALQDSALSSVWVAYATDGALSGVSAGDVYIRSDDTGSVSAPPHPHVEIGQANPDDASADVLLNPPTHDAKEITVTAALAAGGQAEYPVFYEDGEKIELVRWAISLTDGGNDTDLQLEFNPPPTGDAPSSTLVHNNVTEQQERRPIDSDTAPSSGDAISRLTLNHTNGTGTSYTDGDGNGAIQITFQYRRM